MNTLHPKRPQMVRMRPFIEGDAYTPPNPDRTSYRAGKDGIEYMEWPTRKAMLKACNMQPAPHRAPGTSQWKPFTKKEG